MSRERTQLNINIDPALLLSLKSQATKRGQTLTDFVVEQLKGSSDRSPEGNLEQRLLRIEQFLELDKKASHETKKIGTIFTDLGAKEYGEVAKAEFESCPVLPPEHTPQSSIKASPLGIFSQS